MSLKIKTIIVSAGISSLSLFLFFFLVQPYLTQTIKSGEDLISVRKNSATLEAQIKNLKDFRPRYEQEIKPVLQTSEKLFIDPKNPVDFITLMEETAGKNYLSINISSAKIFNIGSAPEESWPSLNFQISLNGQLSGVLRFIEKMANLPYLIEIHGLSIAKDDQTQAPSDLKINTEEKNKKNSGQASLLQKNNVQAVFNLKIYTK